MITRTMAPRYRKWLIAYLVGLLVAILVLHLECPWLMSGSTVWSGAGTGPRAIHVRVVLGDGPSAGQGQQFQVFYRVAGGWRWRASTRALPPGSHDEHYAMDGDRLRITYQLPPDTRGDMLVILP